MRVVIGTQSYGFGLSDKAIRMCIEKGMKCTKYNDNGIGFVDHGDDIFFIERSKELIQEDLDEEEEFSRKLGDDYDPQPIHYFWTHMDFMPAFRTDPRLIEVVESLGPEASSRPGERLVVVDIPFDTLEGWHIHNHYMGGESIREDYRSWGGDEGESQSEHQA